MSFFVVFNCFAVVEVSVLWPEEGDFPENVHRFVCVIINKRSFECFVCLDLVFWMPTFSAYKNTKKQEGKIKSEIFLDMFCGLFSSLIVCTHACMHTHTHTHWFPWEFGVHVGFEGERI